MITRWLNFIFKSDKLFLVLSDMMTILTYKLLTLVRLRHPSTRSLDVSCLFWLASFTVFFPLIMSFLDLPLSYASSFACVSSPSMKRNGWLSWLISLQTGCNRMEYIAIATQIIKKIYIEIIWIVFYFFKYLFWFIHI